MGTTNPEGRITRRGFLEGSSAALASAGLIGNAYAGKSALSSESTADSAKPTQYRWLAKLRSKSTLSLPKLSTQVTPLEISRLKRDTRSSTSAADASRRWIAVVSTSASFRLQHPASKLFPTSRKPSPKRGEPMTISQRMSQRIRNV